jgi:hypothetical protein
MFTNLSKGLNMAAMMALGKMMTQNSFVDGIEEIKQTVDDLHYDDRRKTFVLHMGKNLKRGQEVVNDGGTTFSVGDKSGNYVQIINHGTNLSGMVSVYFDVLTRKVKRIPTAMIVLSVYPLEPNDEPPLGLLWMDDFGYRFGPGVGVNLSWSVEQLQVPAPQLSASAHRNIFKGFSFGMVMHDFSEDSVQVLSNLPGIDLQPPTFLTPMGIGQKRFEDRYLIYHPGSLNKPEEMTSPRFSILETLFAYGICSFNEKHVRDSYLKIPRFDPDDVDRILQVLRKMAMDGWFYRPVYGESIYYVPTIKTMTCII